MLNNNYIGEMEKMSLVKKMMRVVALVAACFGVGYCIGVAITSCSGDKSGDVAKVKEYAVAYAGVDNYTGALEELLSLDDEVLLADEELMNCLVGAYTNLTREQVKVHEGNSFMGFDIDTIKHRLYVADIALGSIEVLSYPGMQPIDGIVLPSPAYDVECSADGSVVVAGMHNADIAVVDCTTGKVINELKGHKAAVRALELRDDGVLFSSSNDHMVRSWDINTGKQIDEVEPHDYNIKSLVMNGDGTRLVTASNDGKCCIIVATEDGRLEEKFTLDQFSTGYVNSKKYANCGAFSTLGSTAATGGENMTVKLWDVATGREQNACMVSGVPTAMSYTQGGKWLAVAASDYVHFINPSTGVTEWKLKMDTASPWDICFMEDGRYVISEPRALHYGEILQGESLIEAARKLVEVGEKIK